MENVKRYYNQPIDAEAQKEGIGMRGAGLIWLITRDQLSPPVNVEPNQDWNPEKLRKATESRVLSLAQKLFITMWSGMKKLRRSVAPLLWTP